MQPPRACLVCLEPATAAVVLNAACGHVVCLADAAAVVVHALTNPTAAATATVPCPGCRTAKGGVGPYPHGWVDQAGFDAAAPAWPPDLAALYARRRLWSEVGVPLHRCPVPGCDAVFEAAATENRGYGVRRACPACREPLCAACGAAWSAGPGAPLTLHAGKSCAAYRQLAAAAAAALPETTKLCPGCGYGVVRVRGDECHSVTCLACKRAFCYVCLTLHVGDAHACRLQCPFYCTDACDCTPAQEAAAEREARRVRHAAAVARHKELYPHWPGPRRFVAPGSGGGPAGVGPQELATALAAYGDGGDVCTFAALGRVAQPADAWPAIVDGLLGASGRGGAKTRLTAALRGLATAVGGAAAADDAKEAVLVAFDLVSACTAYDAAGVALSGAVPALEALLDAAPAGSPVNMARFVPAAKLLLGRGVPSGCSAAALRLSGAHEQVAALVGLMWARGAPRLALDVGLLDAFSDAAVDAVAGRLAAAVTRDPGVCAALGGATWLRLTPWAAAGTPGMAAFVAATARLVDAEARGSDVTAAQLVLLQASGDAAATAAVLRAFAQPALARHGVDALARLALHEPTMAALSDAAAALTARPRPRRRSPSSASCSWR
jgi:hypothetical protein